MADTDHLPPTFVAGFHDPAMVRRMVYRRVPKFGALSVLSLGGSGFAGMHVKGKGTGLTDAAVGLEAISSDDIWFQEEAQEDVEKVADVVVACLKAGINLIDTSHWYGQGRSERLLGHALQRVPREAYYIMTKIGRYEKDPLKMFDFTYAKTYQAGLDSLRRLRCGYIDSLQIHDPEFAPSIDIILEQTLPALQRLKEEGVCRFIGITGYPLEVQQEIISRSPIALDTSLTYCHYQLCDTSLLGSGHVELCERKGIALVNAAAIAMGLHQGKAPVPDWHPASAETRALCKEASGYCAASGVDYARLALHFTTSEPRLATTLCSCTTEEELAANLSNVLDPLSAKEEQALAHIRERIFVPAGQQTWHGVEPTAYWLTVGKALIEERIYSRGAASTASSKRASVAPLRLGAALSVAFLGAAALLGWLGFEVAPPPPAHEASWFQKVVCGQ